MEVILKKEGEQVKFSSFQEAYQSMFTDYCDIVKVKDACQMLCINRKQIYKLIEEGKLEKLDHGKGFLITKSSIVSYVLDCSGVSFA